MCSETIRKGIHWEKTTTDERGFQQVEREYIEEERTTCYCSSSDCPLPSDNKPKTRSWLTRCLMWLVELVLKSIIGDLAKMMLAIAFIG